MFTRLIYSVIFSLIFTCLFAFFNSFIYKKNKDANAASKKINLLFIAYTGFLIALTIIPFPGLNNHVNIAPVNLIPVQNTIHSFSVALRSTDPYELYFVAENTIGNLLVFIPLGILLPLMSSAYRRFGKVLLIALLGSLLIETTQLSMQYFNIYRICDIDDVILNTSGACIGFLFWKSCSKCQSK